MSEQPTTTAPDTTALRDAITREAVLTALHKRIGDALKNTKADVQTLLDAAHAATGTARLDATLPDGTQVGSVTRTPGEVAAQVTDPDVFTAWVRKYYPSEHTVQLVRSVRPAFSTQVLAAVDAAGVPQWADPETGEVHDVPGVAIRPSRARSHALTFSRGSKAQPTPGRELVAEAWRSGALAPVVAAALAPAPE
ncbi:hypothetical protein ACFQ61_01985 [Streptomyces sp. NPDC056500]|uniref:hypothetical protein n=1 Tax=Streptomyces sp. NPDC056500 TaxID=3345840 RepID=UPI00369472FE